MTLRVGSRVRSTGEKAHTDLGRIRHIPDIARPTVAIVAFDCGCAAYIPLRRLKADRTPFPRAAAMPRTAATEQSFDSTGSARSDIGADLYPHAQSGLGASIDDLSTSSRGHSPRAASETARPGQRAAKRDGHEVTAGVDRPAALAGSSPAGSTPRAEGTRSRDPGAANAVSRAPRPAPGGRPGRQKVWTREKIIEAIKVWAAEHGAAPTRDLWMRTEGSHPTERVVRKEFGSFRKALVTAGIERRRGLRDPWTREEIIERIKAHHAEHGCSPSATDWRTSRGGDNPTSTTVQARFGSWAAALEAAGVPQNVSGRHRGALGVQRRLDIATEALRIIVSDAGAAGWVAREALVQMGVE